MAATRKKIASLMLGIPAPLRALRKVPVLGNLIHFLSHVILPRSEEHTSELQSRQYLVCRLLLEKKKKRTNARLRVGEQPTRASPGTRFFAPVGRGQCRKGCGAGVPPARCGSAAQRIGKSDVRPF